MKVYSVINIDIVGSRNVRDRDKLQADLDSYLEHINKKYFNILTCPAAITLGDEWQLITHKPSEAYNLVHEFQQLMWKDDINLYAGIGIGGLSTPVSDDIRKMDGPCFHAARNAINITKNLDKLKNKYNISKSNKIFLMSNQIEDNFGLNFLDFYYTPKSGYNRLTVEEIAAAVDNNSGYNMDDKSNLALDKFVLERTINLIIENNEILKSRMTRKQKDTYISYSALGSYRKVVDIRGENHKETIGGISQKLNSASFFTIQRNQQMVSVLINIFCGMGA